jgi:hypothetical protein
MSGLRLDDGFAGRGDDWYALLMQAHEGLNDAQSQALNARLILILANQIGDLAVLEAALACAQAAGRGRAGEPG